MTPQKQRSNSVDRGQSSPQNPDTRGHRGSNPNPAQSSEKN
jgi:hypothetical protein